MIEDAKDEVLARNMLWEREQTNRKHKVLAVLGGRSSANDSALDISTASTSAPTSQSLVVIESPVKKNHLGANALQLIKVRAGLQIIDFEKEEDRDRDGVRIAMTKYANLLKFLFDKYTAA